MEDLIYLVLVIMYSIIINTLSEKIKVINYVCEYFANTRLLNFSVCPIQDLFKVKFGMAHGDMTKKKKRCN